MRRTKTILIGEVLNEFFQRPYIAARIAEGNIENYWREVVGAHVASYTSDLKIENHILHVRISSSLLRNEIFMQREQLKEQINLRAKHRIVNAIIVK